jgi:dTDP-4-amino-4,6-dideoxygalactose transaminase
MRLRVQVSSSAPLEGEDNMISLFGVKEHYNYQKEEIEKAINGVLESGEYVGSTEVERFENTIKDYLNVAYAVGVGSGTDALILSLKAVGVGPGDYVITSPFTFKGAVQAILYVGAKPIYADIDPYNFNIDPISVENIFSSHEYSWNSIKALIATHLFGSPANITDLKNAMYGNNVKIIEDCAQAFGAQYCTKFVGTIGDIGILSFYPTKVLGAIGDGGMIVTKNEVYAQRVKDLSHHLDIFNGVRKYTYARNSRLDPIQAAILNVKIKNIDNLIGYRQAIAQSYKELIGGMVHHPIHGILDEPVYGLYTIRHPRRLDIYTALRAENIQCGIYYDIPMYEFYREVNRDASKLCPITKRYTKEVLSIPMHPFLDLNDIENVAIAVERGLDGYQKSICV